MDIQLAVLADGANLTSNGKLNVLGIFRNITARAFPAVHPEMTLVLKFEADSVERGMRKKVDVRLVSADGVDLSTISMTVNVPDPPVRGRPIEMLAPLRINNATFPKAGDYEFKALIDGNLATSVPFRVIEKESRDGDSVD